MTLINQLVLSSQEWNISYVKQKKNQLCCQARYTLYLQPIVKTRTKVMLFIKQKAILKNIDVLVCSGGGVGTSFFIRFLQKYKSVNSPGDLDYLKHLDRPPSTLNSNLKAIYIFGDPLDAVESIFRRNMQSTQSRKLLSNYLNIKPINSGCTLNEYLQEGIDKLKLENHFYNWINAKESYPIMLIKYETLWDHLPEIFNYLEIPNSEIRNFPKKKNRHSNWRDLPNDMQIKLYEMYGELSNTIDSIDEIKVINSNYHNYALSIRYIVGTVNTLLTYAIENIKNFLEKHLPKSYQSLKKVRLLVFIFRTIL